jgi:hypothetical protein
VSKTDILPGDVCVVLGCMSTTTEVVDVGSVTEFYTLVPGHMPSVSQVRARPGGLVLGSTDMESLDKCGAVMVLMDALVGWVYGAELRRV